MSSTLQINSVQTCRAILRTLTCWSPMPLTVTRSHSSYLRTTKQTQTQICHMGTSHTTQSRCMEKRDCPRTARSSHQSNIRTPPSILTQTFDTQATSPKSGPSLTLLCLWMAACSQSTPPVCCLPLGPPLLCIRQVWGSPKQTGNRSHQWPHSESGWTEFSTAPLSSSPKRLRCGKA